MEQIRVGVPFTFEIPFRGRRVELTAARIHITATCCTSPRHCWGFDIVAQTPIVIVR